MFSQTNIYLAPFQGITGAVYRDVYSQHFKGIDKLFTPFFTAVHSEKSLSAKFAELEKSSHYGVAVVPQILSNDADEIIRFSKIVAHRGFQEINWNLGCPFKRVASKKRGSGLMPYPGMVMDILERVLPSLPVKLSIKCRLGYDSPDEILEMLKIFNQHPLSELIVHARLGKQIYKGNVDLASFEKVLGSTSIPLVYNGDIFGVEDFSKMQDRFSKINSWMIGRGLLIDPFLPGDIKKIYNGSNLQDRELLIRSFIEDLYLQYRKKLNDRLNAISLMKELWGYMAFSFNNPGKVFGLIKKTKSFEEYEEAVSRVLNNYDWIGSFSNQFDDSAI